MSLLYVNENGATIGVEANKCVVQYRDGMKKMIPIESLEGITIMGQSHLTTKCAEECMCRGMSVAYFSKGGKYWATDVHGSYQCSKAEKTKCFV